MIAYSGQICHLASTVATYVDLSSTQEYDPLVNI